jgi:4-amino-4-deoxy-L-arabinose transferase-like glycosyltransferase
VHITTRRDLGIVAAVAVCANLLIATAIVSGNPEYLTQYERSISPDALHYVTLGSTLWLTGLYSAQNAPPYQPDLLRTPVYPIIAGAVEAGLGVIWPLYLLQVLLSVATALLVYGLAAGMFGRGPAVVAGCLYGADLSVAGINFEALSEPVFVFLSVLALFLWMRVYVTAPTQNGWMRTHLLAGGLLGLALLTRPAGVYLPAVLAVAGTGIILARAQWRLLTGPIALLLVAYAIAAPWVARNNRVYGIPRLTNADTINLLYFAGAGVYQKKYGIERDDAQNRIAAEFGLVPLVKTNNIWLMDGNVRAVDAKQRNAARAIFTADPLLLAEASAIGVAKSFLSHSTSSIGAMAGTTWIAPGLERIRAGDHAGFWRSIRRNTAWLTALFAWQMVMAGVVIASAAVGVVLALARRHTAAAVLLAPALYSMVTIAVVGIDAYWRHRLPITPFACAFAGYGLYQVCYALRLRRDAPRYSADASPCSEAF